MNDTLDVAAVRRDTPGVLGRVHLNNAGAALMPRPVADRVVNHLRREETIGGYEASAEAAEEIETVYDSIARLVNCRRDEIAITENATVAWQRVFYSLTFQPGDRILTASAEFGANYVAFIQMARRTGVTIEVVPNDAAGALDPAALESMLDERVRLIAVTWIPTNGGLINPAEAIGRIARARGIPYLLDACQAVGQMPVDVEAIGCDVLTATGRKFLRAPRGTGFLFIRQALLDRVEPAMIDLYGAPWVAPNLYEVRPDARRFETWEKSYALRLGLGAAVDYALSLGLPAIEQRCRMLSTELRQGLHRVPGITMHDLGASKASIVSFTSDRVESAEILRRLSAQGINVSVSPPSSTLIDATARHLPPVVRASPHYYNSSDEIVRFLECVEAISE